MNASRITKPFSLLSSNLCRLMISHRNEFSSAYSLKNLYPESSLKIGTPDESLVIMLLLFER